MGKYKNVLLTRDLSSDILCFCWDSLFSRKYGDFALISGVGTCNISAIFYLTLYIKKLNCFNLLLGHIFVSASLMEYNFVPTQ